MSAEPQPIDPGLTEISRSTDSFAQRIGVRLVTAVDEILTGTKLIAEKYRQETMYLAICWFCLSFAGFGVQTSVPNQIRSLRNLNYETHRQFRADQALSNIRINTTVENQDFRNMSFVSVTWQPNGGVSSEQSLKIRHVKFERCTFKRNIFINVQTPNTRFDSCTFEETVFEDTDLKSTEDPKFQTCIFDEKTTVRESQECSPQDDDVAGDAAYWEYIVALLGSMAALPGLVACGFLMGRIGRINMLCGGLFTGMIFALFFRSLKAPRQLFSRFFACFQACWFRRDRRSTALGIFIAVSRGGALLGSLYVVNMPLWAGSFLAAAALLAGGIFAIRIQDTGNRPLL
ncbi:Oidioi.mRNA.OKI2018_I69.XSR.g16323.t1.cds [Oikopleura dioica]|uniref:Oidioi.mRNA.OKI2018_I69.XSR.g16323.t1.cds n=1 Tax=Oikopleura dioica TaxID=34765 RepID=A0ABN7SG89_OIKDI|nr:Oidioi.mRNA.OKI2018_I69.XSR.g16323.t1.cds [Oikopleura dioica]